MSERNDGGPAFPCHGSMGEVAHPGMQLRDYFAAKAMQWTLANSAFHGDNEIALAEWAYRQADAMLKAREAR